MNILKKTAFLLFSAVILTVNLAAGTIPFRLGKVYAAEITCSRVNVSGLKTSSFKLDFPEKSYAAVTAKLQPGRSLSIYDFKLRIAGVDYPCVGLRTGDSSFSFSQWKISSTTPGVFYSMLFIIDSAKINSDVKSVEGTLLYNLSSGGIVRTTIPFKVIKSSAFTSGANIPDKGMFKLPEKEKSSK
ncbi:hypothetical protein P0136_09340 [Lentisphaerota bacterium ZTH]|nr:hypothetical protein JYG24_13150 [Lentisphaerota bacterium]WET05567.1 hypothetical protein P0136_09340 [Lentisphaerota bacterium ZTH]